MDLTTNNQERILCNKPSNWPMNWWDWRILIRICIFSERNINQSTKRKDENQRNGKDQVFEKKKFTLPRLLFCGQHMGKAGLQLYSD